MGSKAEMIEYISKEPIEQLWEPRSDLPILDNLDKMSSIVQGESHMVYDAGKANFSMDAIATPPAKSLFNLDAPIVTALFVGVAIGVLLHALVIKSQNKHLNHFKHPLLD